MSEVPVNGPVNGEILCQETDPVSQYLDFVIEYGRQMCSIFKRPFSEFASGRR